MPLPAIAQRKEKTENTSQEDSKESFICIDQTGLIYSLTIELNHIKDGQLALPEDVLYTNMRAMDFKRDLLIFGDTDGTITRFNARSKQTRAILVRRNSEIRKIKFSPGKESLLIAVQFPESVDILDASSNTLEIVSTLRSENSKLKILDSCWSSPDKVLVQFNNSTIKIFQINSAIKLAKPTESINLFTSVLRSNNKNPINQMDENSLIKLKTALFELLDTYTYSSEIEYDQVLKEFLENLNGINKNFNLSTENLNSGLIYMLKNEFAQASRVSKLEKFALLSSYFNHNSFETKFWSLLSYQNTNIQNNVVKQNILLLSASDFRINQHELLKTYREKYELNENVKISVLARDLLLFNELDLVFNLLIETEPKDENYSYNLTKYYVTLRLDLNV
jgi:hypothetical protein